MVWISKKKLNFPKILPTSSAISLSFAVYLQNVVRLVGPGNCWQSCNEEGAAAAAALSYRWKSRPSNVAGQNSACVVCVSSRKHQNHVKVCESPALCYGIQRYLFSIIRWNLCWPYGNSSKLASGCCCQQTMVQYAGKLHFFSGCNSLCIEQWLYGGSSRGRTWPLWTANSIKTNTIFLKLLKLKNIFQLKFRIL